MAFLTAPQTKRGLLLFRHPISGITIPGDMHTLLLCSYHLSEEHCLDGEAEEFFVNGLPISRLRDSIHTQSPYPPCSASVTEIIIQRINN